MDKNLMSGNEAIAQGAWEAGVAVGVGYPGTPSTETLEALVRKDDVYCEWSPNEKVAFEVGLGAAIAGVRALVTMKHVGVNVAADPFMAAASTGVNAGLVLLAADDPSCYSSQNEQDSRFYAAFGRIPCLDVADSADCYEMARAAFALSERFDTPVMLHETMRIAHTRTLVSPSGEREAVAPRDYADDIPKYVMMPANAVKRRAVVDERQAALEAYAETCPYNVVEMRDEKIGVICAGAVYQHVREALPEASTFKLGLAWPLPARALADFGESLTGGIDRLQQDIWAQAGHKFNINSPKQLGEVLFEELMLPAGKKTKTGWSTNADVLEKLVGKHPIIGDILEYRMLTKLKSTYADGLLKVISADGRIHTCFKMTVTATGRLSSTEPNLQNIPVRRELGAQIRRMFVAAPGCLLVDADYSQIELRLLAHISGDETMREAFRSGEDIHAVTASQVFGVPLGEVTPQMRSSAKAVNFGIVYGISAFSLAQDIRVSPAEARAYIEAYLEKYHGVREYMDRVIKEAKERGYVETLFGRRRPVPELKASNFNTRSFGERVARNMPIQGTAADIIKLAMVNVRRRLRTEGLEARLILQVHDQLIAECPAPGPAGAPGPRRADRGVPGGGGGARRRPA